MKKATKPFVVKGPISLRIKAFMDALGMNRFQLSFKAELDNAIVYKCLGGTRKWTLGHLQKIAPALGVKLSDLIEETIMVSRAGGVREGRGPPQTEILRPALDQGGRILEFKEDAKMLAKMYEIVVEDQSLEPELIPGTILTAQRDTADLIRNGNLVVYWSGDGRTAIRRIFLGQDQIILQSLTQGVPDKILPVSQIALCDKIIKIEPA